MSSHQPITATIRAALDRGELIDDEMIRALCSVVDHLEARLVEVERRMRADEVRRG